MYSGFRCSNCCCSASAGSHDTNSSRSLPAIWRPISAFHWQGSRPRRARIASAIDVCARVACQPSGAGCAGPETGVVMGMWRGTPQSLRKSRLAEPGGDGHANVDAFTAGSHGTSLRCASRASHRARRMDVRVARRAPIESIAEPCSRTAHLPVPPHLDPPHALAPTRFFRFAGGDRRRRAGRADGGAAPGRDGASDRAGQAQLRRRRPRPGRKAASSACWAATTASQSHVRDTQDAGAGLVDETRARFIAEHSASGASGWCDAACRSRPTPTGPARPAPHARRRTRACDASRTRPTPPARRSTRRCWRGPRASRTSRCASAGWRWT